MGPRARGVERGLNGVEAGRGESKIINGGRLCRGRPIVSSGLDGYLEVLGVRTQAMHVHTVHVHTCEKYILCNYNPFASNNSLCQKTFINPRNRL